jgi:SAM-dependent MidA family methyltransferase
MTPVARILRDEIARGGPLPFSRFMEAALYHPEFGYYRGAHDPFGRAGDFYTAAQLQPTFGLLIRARVAELWREMGEPADFTVVELGAGREEMAPHFAGWRYVPVDIGRGSMPHGVTGVIFSNEFFDALPVDAVEMQEDGPRELLVGWDGARFVWQTGGTAHEAYARRYFPQAEAAWRMEVNLEALRWMNRIAASLERGYALTIDYGYTTRESVRFPAGTLMSYRRHLAMEDVLTDPGNRDITAHVHFTALEDCGASAGLERVRFETLAQTITSLGEDTLTPLAQSQPQQIKTLLFGMGETFRVLLQRKRP